MTRSEYLEGRIFVQFLKKKGLLFSHLPLNTWTNSYAALARNKASGVVKGVPDYVVIIPPYTLTAEVGPASSSRKVGGKVLFVELKRVKGGRTSPEQKRWVEALTAAGCPSRICRGAGEAIEFVEEFL